MAKFRVRFKGYAYVTADDAEEAKEKLEDEEYSFLEYVFDSVEEVQEDGK